MLNPNDSQRISNALANLAEKSFINTGHRCFWCEEYAYNSVVHNGCISHFKAAIISLFSASRRLDKKQSIRKGASKR